MGEKKRVLVIDDHESMRGMIKEYLEELNVDPILAATGEEGLRMAREESPDHILLDIMLPDVMGDDVAAQLREDPETEDIPITFLTALASKADAEKRNAVIPKDLDPNEMIARLKKVLFSDSD